MFVVMLGLRFASNAARAGEDEIDKGFIRIATETHAAFRKQLQQAGLITRLGATPWSAVAAGIERVAPELGREMVGWWNNLAKGGWATIGPRRLGASFETGELTSESSRLWVATAPVLTETTIEIKKRSGGLKTRARIWLMDDQGRVRMHQTYTFAGGKKNEGEVWKSKPITGPGAVVGVKLDGQELLPDSFSYAIRIVEKPLKVDTQLVAGFADLHLHQMAEYAHGGGWIHGGHAGDPAKVLPPCSPLSHAIPNWLYELQTEDHDTLRHGKGWPTFKDWPHQNDSGHQQVFEDWLKRAHDAGLNLIVMCAVNSEPLALLMGLHKGKVLDPSHRDMPTLRKQIEAAHRFAETHDWYEIVYTPWHARQAIHTGKLAVVLSVECSHLFPASEGHYSDQLIALRDLGVRSLQIVHETDSRFAGAAPHRKSVATKNWIKDLVTPVDNLESLLKGNGYDLGYDLDAEGHNKLGLTHDGAELVEALMKEKMLVDTAHMSFRTLDDVYSIAKKHIYYPLFSSHTRFEPMLTDDLKGRQRELVTTPDQLRYYRETGGLLGLRTSDDHGLEFRDSAGHKPLPVQHPGSIESFAQLVLYAEQQKVPIAFGTDMNGVTPQTASRYVGKTPAKSGGPGLDPEYLTKGLAHIGLLPSLLADLDSLKIQGSERLHHSAEAFLKMWERAYQRTGPAR